MLSYNSESVSDLLPQDEDIVELQIKLWKPVPSTLCIPSYNASKAMAHIQKVKA